MHVIPLHTQLLRAGDSLASILRPALRDGDVVVLSSKAVATVEGAAIDLLKVEVSEEAKEWSLKTHRSPAFCEAVLRETARMHGKVKTHCEGVMLTQLHPEGLQEGELLVPNAGLDESNVGHDHAIGWPHDSLKSVISLKNELGTDVAIILTDSCIVPRRKAALAFALACSGIDPFKNEIGNKDLFGKPLKMTVEAVADQLAVIGNAIMGNAAQATPAAIIRDHGIPLTEFEGWVSGIEPEKDVFRDMFKGIR
jgi:coenzyme F420-0:L-glutamate ligase / coenzyme F420-1:gamma-L-glutamate ligase